MEFIPQPEPVAAEEATVLEEVTKGYVPWSTSKRTPWAPSNNIFLFWDLNSSIFFHTGCENLSICGAILKDLFLIALF